MKIEKTEEYKNVNSISTIKINPYEIAKAEDINNGFTSILKNISLLVDAFSQSTRDFIIGGDIQILPNSLKIKINPYIAFCKASGILYCNMNDTVVELTKSNTVYNRIDVICIGGEGWVDFKKETRAMSYVVPDMQDNSMFAEVNKKQKQKIDIIILEGEIGNAQAKKVESKVIKIAEIEVKASREVLDNGDVRFISKITDDDNEKNYAWTQDKYRTFYIFSLSTFLSKYYKIHKKDGDLKNGVVKAHHIALSDGNALTAIKILLGKDIILKSDKSLFHGADKPYIQITSSNSIKEAFDILCQLLIRFWDTFIEQDFAVYEASKQHTDVEITNTKNEFNAKLATEKEQRIKADEKEKQERINAITQERNERIEGDEKNRQLAEKAYKLSLPVGSHIESYQNDDMESFLALDGKSFSKEKYPNFYEYWKKYLSQFDEDDDGNPILPFVEIEDDSRLGELATFIGTEYHDEFLICDGSPFSPDIYHVFYHKYWTKYLSYLGTDDITGWPLRPKLKSLIAGSNVYIKVLPQIKNEWIKPFIKVGE